ncbi:MAG: FHA domain-containing protein, partial [Isosphaeraceae bacterium]|nr:FHA domain-containing protein [Isosphaeraceae bacterium]
MDAKPAGIIGGSHWALEVVRGRDTGRLYTLNGGEIVLGNALGGVPGIDLADQEGTSPRRMAPCQARLECSQAGVTLRDLDSPGGTFVNRQRLRPGQARVLQAGDVIQLGGVQLRLIHHSGASPSSPTPPPPPRPQPATTAAPAGRPPLAFTLKTGPTCRSWDDFLIVSAQRWAD